MRTVFDAIFNMSITGSIVILVVIFARWVLQNAPKKYSYILWSVAGFRLCCPFSFKSVVSLFNINPFQKPDDIVTNSGTMNYIDAPVYVQNPQLNIEAIGGAEAPTSVLVQYHFTDFLPYIWISGCILLLTVGIINFIKTRKQLLSATKKYDNIYQSENIASPFILGILKPKIYVPYNMEEEYFDYVIAHENYHLKRGDNIIKLLAFVILCVHWFNPFCWLAFYLFNKDMEMSCDEWVLSHNDGIKKAYSYTLLFFATDKKFPVPTPLCFGESSAKSRIKNVLKYKKPAVIVSIIAILLCLSVTIVCVANPTESVSTDTTVSSDAMIRSYDFIYNDYWYNVVKDGDDIQVICEKYNRDYTLHTTFYTLNKNGKWSTKTEQYRFSFDENNTINIYYSDTEYSHSWWYINTESQVIEERDKGTQEVLQTLIPIHENSVSAAKKAIALSLKPYQYINGYANTTSSWSNNKITIELGGYRNMQLRWAVEKGVSIKSAELVIAIDKKEVFTEPMTIENMRKENPNNHTWDYLAYTKKNTYVIDCKSKESACEVYAKCIDDKGAEYHVYLTPTEFNTDSNATAYTYILYNGYEFWYY